MKHFLEREKEAFTRLACRNLITLKDGQDRLVGVGPYYHIGELQDFLTASHTRLIEEVIRMAEGMKIKERGKITMFVGDPTTRSEIEADTNRAVFHNNAINSIITKLKEGI